MVFTRTKLKHLKSISLVRAMESMVNSTCMLMVKGDSMTKNQIEYWRNVEQQRANRAAERETFRSNTAREQENVRSNMANEAIKREDIAQRARDNSANRSETIRSNIAREVETNRSNLASEQLNQQRNVLTSLANSETMRSNIAKENISRQGLTNEAVRNANEATRNMQNYSLGRLTNLTNQRGQSLNYAVGMGNIKTSQERNRLLDRQTYLNAMLQKERNTISSQQVDLGLQNLAELQRHNKVSEYINAFSTALRGGLMAGRSFS